MEKRHYSEKRNSGAGRPGHGAEKPGYGPGRNAAGSVKKTAEAAQIPAAAKDVGTWQDLVIVHFETFGAYLGKDRTAPKEEQVLLPKKQVPEGAEAGDILHVFLYRDSDDRLIATVNAPAVIPGEVASLTVKEVTKIGAFLDWGLEKDLLLPYHEQTKKVKAGESILVSPYVDKSGRLCATMNVYPYLSSRSPYHAGQTVQGVAYEKSNNFGVFVAVDGKYSGRIPKEEAPDVEIGTTLTLRVSRVLPDGRLSLSLRQNAYKMMEEDGKKIERIIRKEYDGVLPFDDKAEPERIRKVFGLSKAAFKRAVGGLLKEERIILEDGTISLTDG